MKNFFLVNKDAGSRRKIGALIAGIEKAVLKSGADAEIYFTKSAQDCIDFIHKKCREFKDHTVRFFGCGGDGTLNLVVNGCAEHENAVAANVPIGTGNDFVRSFGKLDTFKDISAQLAGTSVPVDLIRCEYIENGEKVSVYCDNMINIGFDSNVVERAAAIRKKGVFTGSFAYLAGVVSVLVEKKGADLVIEYDGEKVYDGPLLLTAVANGNYCGGGVKSSPQSVTGDGVIEGSIIKDVTRRTFLKLFPSYSRGTHVDKLKTRDILIYRKVKEVHIRTNGEVMRVSNDGELIHTDELWLKVEPGRLMFSVPEGISL